MADSSGSNPTSNNATPISIVIFGASGDLTRRKLIPALYNLYRKHRLPEQFTITGFSNLDWNDQVFRDTAQEGLKQFSPDSYTDELWGSFGPRLAHMTGNFTNPADFTRLKETLERQEQPGTGRLYYLATPPPFFTSIVDGLGQAGMVDQQQGWRRVVIEKPFGSDLDSARKLNKDLHRVLEENQIYRIDHYLGKETVQNILVLRFANTIFEPVWNNKYIDCVEISVAEEVGVEHRAGYYEKAGVLRDMFQNHLLQLLTLVALEPPETLKHNDLHARKMQVLHAIRPIAPEACAQETVRGQYHGYHDEPGVAPDSQTPTFAALRLSIDTPRWEGVPFFLRSGKKLAEKSSEIILQFKCPPFAVEPMPPSNSITPDMLSICIQPDEGVYLRFEAKVPDTVEETRSVEMEFHYSAAFGPTSIPEAYERLILDALHGDLTLFTRDDQAEQAWKLIDPIIEGWNNPQNAPLEIYEPGSWGPEGAEALLNREGFHWHIACGKLQDI